MGVSAGAVGISEVACVDRFVVSETVVVAEVE